MKKVPHNWSTEDMQLATISLEVHSGLLPLARLERTREIERRMKELQFPKWELFLIWNSSGSGSYSLSDGVRLKSETIGVSH